MAEYSYTIDNFSLTTTWKDIEDSTGAIEDAYDIVSGSTTKIIDTTNIVLAEGERVQKVLLTATITRSGTYDFSEIIKVNTLSFSAGSKRIPAETFTAGSAFNLNFYVCATGEASQPPTWDTVYNYSCTINFSNITLTVTTGTGSAFDGTIGSLEEGTKIFIEESTDVFGTYTIMQHNYNEGKCLLWRDTCISQQLGFNHGQDSYISDNGGLIDSYLTSTFYEGLTELSKASIVAANYSTLTKRGGTVEAIERFMCVPSLRELKENQGYEEGTLFDYLATMTNGENYWTRSVSGSSGLAYRIGTTGNSYTYDRSYTTGVRPCCCVLETQLLVEVEGGYKFSQRLAAPSLILLNDGATDLFNKQLNYEANLSWEQISNAEGYAIWVSSSLEGEYELLHSITEGNNYAILGPSTPKTTYYYKVQALGPTEEGSSLLSETVRSISTKNTNLSYYNGDLQRLLVNVWTYHNGEWKVAEVKTFKNEEWK